MKLLTLLSFGFFIFFAVSLIIYYILPPKIRWAALLAFSMAFFLLSSSKITVVFPAWTMIITTLAVRGIDRAKSIHSERTESDKTLNASKLWMLFGVIGNLGALAFLKYTGFAVMNINLIAKCFGAVSELIPMPRWSSPVGVSFYTLSAIGYIVDCYWGICKPEKNVFKNALFIGYWPVLTSGPILKYNDIRDELFGEHRFDYDAFCFGLQRLIWGAFKKLIISMRLGTIVDTIYSDTSKYNGAYIWVAAVCFTLQLYTDFSGCMDIIIGASECYGIRTPENFRTPFFAKTIQEFWQRWHITLGTWFKEYILYPVLNTGWMTGLEKKIKKKRGRKTGRLVTSCFGMLFVWLLFGLWHGGGWNFVIMGLYFWILIVFETVTHDFFIKLWNKLKIRTESVLWKLLRCFKVFVLVTIGYMFFRLSKVSEAFYCMGTALHADVSVLWNGSLLNLGVNTKNMIVLGVGVFVLLVVSLLKRRMDIRQIVAQLPLVIRWMLYLALILSVLIFGIYGPGYDAQAFIYGGF